MYEVKMPRLGVTMQNGTINQWLIDEGDEIKKGDYIFEIETEKSTLEIEAQDSGVLKKVIVPEGEEVSVNTVVGIIAEPGEEVDLSSYTNREKEASSAEGEAAKETSTTAVSKKEKKKAVPRARKLAAQLGVDLSEIDGSGKDGLITVKDVEAHNGDGSSGALKVKETIPLNHVQKAMSDNMLESWQTIPQFTQMVSVNMEQVLKVKQDLEQTTLNDILIKVLGEAAASKPIVNSRFDKDKKVKVFDEVNVSVAVNSKEGLVVPVVKKVPSLSLKEISEEMKSIVEKAGSGSLGPEDYSDGTITLSNLGSAGIETGTPIINTPQSTLVFVGAIKKTPVVNEEDEVVVAPIMMLSVCYDHRFIDGATGAEFTNLLKTKLENLTREELTG